MKAAAAFFFAAAGVWLGLYLRGNLYRRVQILHRLCALLREIENRTAVLHFSLPQTVQALAQNEAFRSLPFLGECMEHCRAGLPFSTAWSISVTAFLRAQKLRGEGAQMLPQLGASLTCMQETQLERLIAFYSQALQTDLQQAHSRLQSTGKLDVYLCAGGGVLLGIMVL